MNNILAMRSVITAKELHPYNLDKSIASTSLHKISITQLHYRLKIPRSSIQM